VHQEQRQQRLAATTAELDGAPVSAGLERAEDAVLDQAPSEPPSLPRRYQDVTGKRPRRATLEDECTRTTTSTVNKEK
jgi:hypothetical protein